MTKNRSPRNRRLQLPRGAAALILCCALAFSCSKPKQKVILVSSKQRLESMKIATTKRRLRVLTAKIDEYRARHKGYPTSLHALSRSQQLRLLPLDLLDGWNRPLRYRLIAGRPRVCSDGADGRLGGDDDLCYGPTK